MSKIIKSISNNFKKMTLPVWIYIIIVFKVGQPWIAEQKVGSTPDALSSIMLFIIANVFCFFVWCLVMNFLFAIKDFFIGEIYNRQQELYDKIEKIETKGTRDE